MCTHPQPAAHAPLQLHYHYSVNFFDHARADLGCITLAAAFRHFTAREIRTRRLHYVHYDSLELLRHHYIPAVRATREALEPINADRRLLAC